MRKKVLAWLLIGVMGISSVPCDVLADTVEKPTLQVFDAPKNYYLTEKGKPSESGYQDYEWVDENGEILETKDALLDGESLFDSVVQSGSIPASYDMRNVNGENLLPAIRNQGNFGTCWAHAALASVETNMVKKYKDNSSYSIDTSIDYSERHLAYFAHTKNNAQGDGVDTITENYGKYDGGNAQQAIAMLGSWYGAAEEADYPYSGVSKTDSIAEKYRTVSVAHLTDANELKTASDIKQAVMEKGAVQCSYYSSETDGEYVYRNDIPDSNHAVAIVGWDDAVEKSNFNYHGEYPTKNGAWLCRNSWGTESGNNGYFWISYEDSSLNHFWSYEAEPADIRHKIFQYDGAGYKVMVQPSIKKAANAFTADGDYILREVGFYTQEADTYQVDIYLGEETETEFEGIKDLYIFPQTPIATAKGNVEYGGYHTVDLPEDVRVVKDQRFIVVLSTGSGKFFAEAGTKSGSNYTCQANESYIPFGQMDTIVWKEAQNIDTDPESDSEAELVYGNVCIKVTADAMTEAVARKLKSTSLIKERYTAETVHTKEALEAELPKTVTVITNVDTKEEAEAKVIWETESDFVVTGGTYDYIGTLQSDENLYIPTGFSTVNLRATVDAVVISNPDFDDVKIPMDENVKAANVEYLNGLGEELFPSSGVWQVGNNASVTYSIVWDTESTIDLSNPKAKVTFSGTIEYQGVENWMTLPTSNVVNRKITILEPNYYKITLPKGTGFTAKAADGYSATKVYIGKNFGFSLTPSTGYDLSDVVVKVEGTEIEASEGIYLIENVTANVTDITVDDVYLDSSLYKTERTEDNKMRITPVKPATKIKLTTDPEYQSEIEVDGTEEVAIKLQDSKGVESRKIVVPVLDKIVLKEMLTLIPEGRLVSAQKGYTLEELKAACLPLTAEFETEDELNWTVNVIWTTDNVYDAKGTTYVFKGVLEDDGTCSNTGDFSFETTVVVEPFVIALPEFEGIIADWKEGVTATPEMLGNTILPTEGVTEIEEYGTVNYQIAWDEEQTINLENAAETVTFTGTVTYTDAPDWLTIPEEPVVTRQVTVGPKPACRITLPSGTGYEAMDAEGYRSDEVMEGNTYKFVLNATEGYDLSEVVVKVNGTEVIEEDGTYAIENVTGNIENITVENVLLKNTLYKATRTRENKLSITPIEPATGIKLAGEEEYQNELLVDGTEAVEIMLQDAEGIESTPIVIPALGDIVLKELVTVILAEQKVPAYHGYDTEALAEAYLPRTVTYSTEEGINWDVDVTWSTDSPYDIKGATYLYTASLVNDGICSNTADFSIEATIIVEPEILPLPTFRDAWVGLQEGVIATVETLGNRMLPTEAVVILPDNSKVNCQIVWDENQSINLGINGESVVFTGTAAYTTVPEWATLPEDRTVTRRLTVTDKPMYQVILPTGAGYTATDAEGYWWEQVLEGDSYQFVLEEKEGYDLSDVVVRVNGTELLGENGVYTIENIIANVDNITVGNVELKNTLFKAVRTPENKLSITPIAPAIGVKLVGNEEYQTEVLVDGTTDVEILLQDAEGTESEIAIVPALGDLVLTELITEIPERQEVPVYHMYTPEELAANYLPATVNYATEEGVEWDVDVLWSTETEFDVKGTDYVFIGSLVDDGIGVNFDAFRLEVIIAVKPEILPIPVFEDIYVPSRDGIVATAEILGAKVLPVEGVVEVEGYGNIGYQIDWDISQTLNLENIGESAEFTGIVQYPELPEWATVLEDLTVTRKVTVREAKIYENVLPTGIGYIAMAQEGYSAESVVEGTEFKFIVEAVEGYDLSSILVKAGETELVAVDGVYCIEEADDSIQYITVENVQLKNTLFKAERTPENKLSIIPIAPAVRIKLTDTEEYQTSLLLDGTEEVEILLQDENGLTSEAVIIPALGEIILTELVTELPEHQTVSVRKLYTPEELIEKYLPTTVTFDTEEGVLWDVNVTWNTDTLYDMKGATYVFEGKLTDDGICSNVEDIVLEATIVVEPEIINTPVFGDTEVPWQKDATATAANIGNMVLPTLGSVYVKEYGNVNYKITWDTTTAIHLYNEGESTVFYGYVQYENAPQWITVPEIVKVSRKVTVGRKAVIMPYPARTILAVGNLKYKVLSANPENPTVEFVGAIKKNKTIKIPATITYGGITYSVTHIAEIAFKKHSKLTSLTIGANVTTIRKNAFVKCKNLKKIKIQSKVLKTVGKNAFRGIKSNVKITVPKSKYAKYKKLLRKKGVSKYAKFKKS